MQPEVDRGSLLARLVGCPKPFAVNATGFDGVCVLLENPIFRAPRVMAVGMDARNICPFTKGSDDRNVDTFHVFDFCQVGIADLPLHPPCSGSVCLCGIWCQLRFGNWRSALPMMLVTRSAVTVGPKDRFGRHPGFGRPVLLDFNRAVYSAVEMRGS